MQRLAIAFATAGLLIGAAASQAQGRSSPHPGFRTFPAHGCCAGRRFVRDGFFFPVDWETPFSSDYAEAPPPPTVVVIREDRQPQPVTAVQAQPPPAPKVIEIPRSKLVAQENAAVRVPALFVLTDGRKIEASNYTLTHRALIIHQRAEPNTVIPLEQLELEATVAANRQRGVNLRIPQSAGEIYIGF